ncbi:MAG: aldehyde ferredoxin oxidoreductase family protein [Thermoplasmatota archaeon]
MKGYFGKFLEVELADEELKEYKVPEEWYRKYLGGRGLIARIMLDILPKGVDPLGPENVLIYGTGPLQGTRTPGAGRNIVMAKSPKTGGVSGSYVGGFFPHELGGSGYDGIIIKGKAHTPKYLSIVDGEAELLDAEDLWGVEIAEVDKKLKEKHGGGRVSAIGKAGEKLVKFACIMNDRNRAAGRPGFGAVMGSKKLKAILVKGGFDKPLADDEKFDEFKSKINKKLPPVVEWGKYGTTSSVGALNELGVLPTKNFQEGVYDYSEDITGETMYEKILVDRDNCTGCPVRCKRVVNTEYLGEEVKEVYGGPEYETLASFGSLCMNNDLDVIALANQKCNAYGLDTISTGITIAFAMEASEKGLLEDDIGWGDGESMIELIEKIANREGIGDELAEGVDYMAEELGAEFDMQVKGQEIPMHEPRGKSALAVSYTASPRGPNHMEVLHDTFKKHPPELRDYFEKEVDRFDLESKPWYNYVYENIVSFTNSVIYCAFHGWDAYFQGESWMYPEIRGLIEGSTGMKIDVEEMLTIGERNFNLLKILSAREGITKKDDRLKSRFFESLPRGVSSHSKISSGKLDDLIDRYYEYRGWNEYGPTKEKLEEIGMEGVVKHVDW